MRIAVCRPQVPFVYGGAEVVADQLVDELRLRGHETELIAIPFVWYPGTRVLDQALIWRLLEPKIARGHLHRVRLWESPDLYADCVGEAAS